MRILSSALWLFSLVLLLTTGPVRTHATGPVGLDAIERFDLISSLRYGVRTYQYSSHDPTGGNGDRGHYLYQDGSEYVMLDVKGPGCIYRFWFTGPRERLVRLYFDGASTPLFEMTLETFFSGTQAPFLAPLVGNNVVSSGGYYCYLPMLFRQGCKITTTDGDLYYNITFQRFADAEGVTTFTGNENSSAARALWNSAGADPKPDHGVHVATGTVNLPVSSSVTMANVAGAGIIQQLEITIPGLVPGSASQAILSGLKLKAYWDWSAQASVNVPLGDFFGSGLGIATVDGLAVGMDNPRLYCYFPMPFATNALLRLANEGAAGVNNVTYAVRYDTLAEAPLQVGYFHARFLSETPTTTGRDYLVLEETGAGHFVGVTQAFDADLPDRWYLEGDERIHVDGQATPALYGTGTEDFYNGGWYFEHGTFALPVHGCPRHNYMPEAPPFYDACYRFFLSDLVPFTRSIHVGIEHGWTNDVNANERSVAFYYKVPQVLATLCDELDVGNAASESAHAYQASGVTWSGSKSGSYEGDNDDVSINDDGKRLNGWSQFTLAVSPSSNGGVLLRRRMDYSFPRQEGRVYVDGTLLGSWYEPGQNASHVWRDSELLIPRMLTLGKSAITIRIENTSPYSDWTEHRYWVYTQAAPEPAIAADPAVLEPSTTYQLDPPPDTFTVRNSGGGTLEYAITDDADWLSVMPETGDGTGEADAIQVSYLVQSLEIGTHEALITVSSSHATNSPQTVSVQIEIKPTPGDFDLDHDVDQTDFGHFQVCLSGRGVPQTAPDCQDARLDGDEDVDDYDFGMFAACLSGSGIEADPHCAD